MGEVGLTGEVRPVSAVDQRLAEAKKLGFSAMILPAANAAKATRPQGLNLIAVERISLALTQMFQ